MRPEAKVELLIFICWATVVVFVLGPVLGASKSYINAAIRLIYFCYVDRQGNQDVNVLPSWHIIRREGDVCTSVPCLVI
jgi:hypothetical protein